MNFSKFMARVAGRILRIIAGAALIYLGFFVMKNRAGYIIGVIGFAPLLASIFDFCIFAQSFGIPFMGKPIRAYTSRQ